MFPTPYRLLASGFILLPLQAGAAGFGEITLLSGIGEPLHAEVRMVGSDIQEVGSACFNLVPVSDSDLPAITAAKIRLVREGTESKLLITGRQPIADPIFVLGLRAGCGIELRRDFVLMPQMPMVAASAPGERADPPPPAPSRPLPGQNWLASEYETLRGIAENMAPADMARQQRILAALKRSNPHLDADTPLAEGTVVRIPKPRQQTANAATPQAGHRSQPRAALAQQSPPGQEASASAGNRIAPDAGGGDRLVLGAPPEDFKPMAPATPPRGSIAEMDQRMLKLESTLQLLHQEVDKLNQALILTAEALTVQEKLQAAKALQSASQEAALKVRAPAASPLPDGPQGKQGDWIELAASALLGGVIASFAAHFLSRRRERSQAEPAAANPVARAGTPAPPANSSIGPLSLFPDGIPLPSPAKAANGGIEAGKLPR